MTSSGHTADRRSKPDPGVPTVYWEGCANIGVLLLLVHLVVAVWLSVHAQYSPFLPLNHPELKVAVSQDVDFHPPPPLGKRVLLR